MKGWDQSRFRQSKEICNARTRWNKTKLPLAFKRVRIDKGLALKRILQHLGDLYALKLKIKPLLQSKGCRLIEAVFQDPQSNLGQKTIPPAASRPQKGRGGQLLIPIRGYLSQAHGGRVET